MFENTKALVLREVRYKEADRLLTVFSSTGGKMTVKARGALRKGSKIAAATQQLTYSDMTLFGNRDRFTVNEASVIEPFSDLRTDIGSFALSCYFTECIEALSVEDQPDEALLQLILNSLYALDRRLYPPEHIKATFELRLMSLCGYEPQLDSCSVCGRETPDEPILGLKSGGVCCRTCRGAELGDAVSLCAESLEAMRYIVSAPAKQLFSFKVDEDAQKRLSVAAEKYILTQTERRYGTLDYWKKIK